MKLLELVPDAQGRTVFFSWTGFPDTTVSFIIYVVRRGDPASDASDTFEDARILGTTTNSFFSDMRFYDSTILRREDRYMIKALNAAGEVVDSLVVAPHKMESLLARRILNGAQYAAWILFRNYNWSETAYILRYRKTGVKCECYSRDFGTSKNPGCTKCFGGGYVGGFYDPLPTKILPISVETKDQDIEEVIPTGADIRHLTLPRFPAVHKGDFIVNRNYGYLSVVYSSFNTLQSKPTPTLMVKTASLGREHIVHKYDFEAVTPEVTGIAVTEPGTISIIGKNIIPRIGAVKLIVGKTSPVLPDRRFAVTDLKHVTSEKVTFRCEEATLPLSDIPGKVFLNNDIFDII